MAGSASERAIRDAVAAFLRRELPTARIVHELVCGGSRADLAAIERERVLLFEVKSEKDVLTRLPTQLRDFTGSAHGVVLVAHEKWFDKTPYNNGSPRLAWPHRADWRHDVWVYPETTPDPYRSYQWRLPRRTLAQPHAAALLCLLWKAELLAEAERHRIAVSGRSRVPDIIELMAWHMTGAEIARAACRQLRARPFPEADAPILEQAEAAHA
jgi:hypothetical protein